MRSGLGHVLLLGGTLFFSVYAKENNCIADDTNHPVCIQHAQRVLVLAPHLTEIMDFAGGLNKVLAVDSASNFPAAVASLPKVDTPSLLGVEAILARKPDLVLAWQSGISASTVAQLRATGVAVFVSEPRSIEQVASNMRRISQLMGTSTQTNPKVDRWLAQFSTLKTQYKNSTPVPVFYQVWNQPLMTLGGQHVVSEIISLCGGRNIFADLPGLAAQVGTEAVLKRKPAVLLSSGSEKDHGRFVSQWAIWPQIPAVKNSHVYSLPNDILIRNGPRLLEATRLLCAHIQQARQ